MGNCDAPLALGHGVWYSLLTVVIQEHDMDGAIKTNRKYPAYTLAELEAAVAAGRGNQVMLDEIAARKAGTSKVLTIPQIVKAVRS